LAFDEARFGLINGHKGFRPAHIVQRVYEWTYLYAAVDPATGEGFCVYLPHLDSRCFETFLEHLGEVYAAHRLVIVLDNAPSHISKEVELPQNVSLLPLPAYSPELNPVERWFEEFRRTLANRPSETIGSLQDALTRILEPYWEKPGRLRSLTGFSWWTAPSMRRDVTNADRYNRSQALFRASCAQPPLAENGTKGLLRSAPRRAYGGHKPGPAGLPYRGGTHPADRRPGAIDLRPTCSSACAG
jgi:transposase